MTAPSVWLGRRDQITEPLARPWASPRRWSELTGLDPEDVEVLGVLDIDQSAVGNARRLGLVGRLAFARRLGDRAVLQLHDAAFLVGALEQQAIPVRELRVDDPVLRLEGLAEEVVEELLRAPQHARRVRRGFADAYAPQQHDL